MTLTTGSNMKISHRLFISCLTLGIVILFFSGARAAETATDSPPSAKAKFTNGPIKIDGIPDEAAWKDAFPVMIEKKLNEGTTVPELSSEVRTLWTEEHLYIAYRAPYKKLTVFEPAIFEGKRVGLWNADVLEAYIGASTENIDRYTEFQVAPSGEKLDLKLELPHRDFIWESGFEAASKVDEKEKIWTAEMRIPLSAISGRIKPKAGTIWKINYYRHDIDSKTFLSWTPTFDSSAHIPKRFGFLEFVE